MRLPLKVVLLVVLSATQLTAAAWSIFRYEMTLATGSVFKVKTFPVDPADPFRGRYVAIQPALTLPNPLSPEVVELLDTVGNIRPSTTRRTAYAVMGTDVEGFAQVVEVVPEPPRTGDYLEIAGVRLRAIEAAEQGRQPELVRDIVLPFDRYYMAESAAPAAEQRYRETARRDDDIETWITVRVRNGIGVIEGLFIDGVRIEDVVRRSAQ
jgi:uncharacterized membrane-anchored protein